jgi:uncharacterized damage-inducible protein DinB
MTSFFQEIFEYHHHFNQKLIDELKKHEKKLPQRTFPLFCHVLNAHHIWNARILRITTGFGVQDIHPIEACKEIDDKNYSDTKKIIETVSLEENITYKTFKGEEFSNTVRDILFHVVNHSTHHKGQIISDFRQQGIVPITTDYIFYKR